MSLRLTGRRWATIDASIDNAASLMRDSGQDDEPAPAIRPAGWDQVPWVGPDKEWPPDAEIVTIRLRRDQWDFALSCFERDAPIYADLGDETSLLLVRDAEGAIRSHLP